MKRHFTISTQGKILNFLAIVFLIFTVVSSFLTMVANDNAAKIRDRKYEFTKNINLFSDACVYLTDQVRTYAATKEQHHYDNYWNEVNNDCRREASQETLYTLGITDQEKALIDEVQQISNKLVPFEELAMEAVSNNDIDKALSILYGEEYEVGVEKISSIVDDLNDSIAQRTNSELAHQKKMVSINTVETFTCMLLVILIQLYNILFVKRKLLVPLDKVKNSISQLAEGNLSAELDLPEDTTEIGQLVSAFNKNTYNLRIIISDLAYLTSEMSNGNFDINTEHEDKYIGDYGRIIQSLRNINRKLNTALTDIKNSAEQVNAGSDQVSGGAQALSQ
ncbi:MAG: methyl-accepting chemotaxis protein, partial [Oscillospiraceae bacterium]